MFHKLFIKAFMLYLVLNIVRAQNYTNYDENYGKTWMYFPDGDGVPQVIYLTEPPTGTTRGLTVKSRIHFELYTRQSRSPKVMQLRTKRDTSLDEFNNLYKPNKETKIIIHGWRSSTNSDTVQKIKDSYLQKYDINVIAVDWESVASNFFYFTPATQTKDVGRYVSELIYYLITDRGTDLNKIHIIGHSLGAHAAGYAGSFIGLGKVSRITGLDPAMPKFDNASPNERLDTSDAHFVDVIHSCAGTLGIKQSIGHIDFYPNNGEAIQPGCSGVKEITEACSHGRSHRFFAESIITSKGFYGHACESYDSYTKGKCPSNTMIMGDQTPSNARGVYYLKTNAESPFALGNV